MSWGLAPCLTKTRGQSHAFWSMQHGRPLTVREMCRLQGLNPDWLNVNVSSKQMGGLLGNGFACTVLARIIAAAIEAVEGNSEDSGQPQAAKMPPAIATQPQAASQPQTVNIPQAPRGQPQAPHGQPQARLVVNSCGG